MTEDVNILNPIGLAIGCVLAWVIVGVVSLIRYIKLKRR